MKKTRAVLLLSGGLDSAVMAYRYVRRGSPFVALSFDYAQRHSTELNSAALLAAKLGVEQRIVKLDFSHLTNNPLAGVQRCEVPLDRAEGGVAPTFVPGRNTIFLATALSLAESMGSDTIAIAASGTDQAGYPDCRDEYFAAFEEMAAAAAGNGSKIHIHRPYVSWKKQSIVAEGNDYGVPFVLTWSCYQGGVDHCGRCDACTTRRQAFIQARVPDPTIYAS